MGVVQKTYQEINEKIRKGQAVVLTAEEMVGVVKKKGPVQAAREVDVVTTGTFAPMCSSGAFINFGHTQPPIKASKVWLNDVPAYGGVAAVDIFIGATEPAFDDPLNKIRPGSFDYGGGHVLHDLVSGKPVRLRAEGYGTDCYPNRQADMTVTLADLPYAVLCNPRNAYQNYNCAVNLSQKTIFTYMGTLKPRLGNANYSTSGQLSPLLNDPYYKTLGLGTRIFLGGGAGIHHLARVTAQSQRTAASQRCSQEPGGNAHGHGRSQTDEASLAHGCQHAGIRLLSLPRSRNSHSDSQRRDGLLYRGIRRRYRHTGQGL